MKLGVFDSGIGGQAVAQSLAQAFADSQITTISDRDNLPYGTRPPADIRRLTLRAIAPLLTGNNDYIVLACNTVTAVMVEELRRAYPEQSFIGLEPMIKPAVTRTLTGTVTICATPATLASARYQSLKQQYGKNVTFFEPDCSTWASLIEDNVMTEAIIKPTLLDDRFEASDVIVLACTHYHWIRTYIEQLAGPDRIVLDPSAAIIQRIQQLESTRQQPQ